MCVVMCGKLNTIIYVILSIFSITATVHNTYYGLFDNSNKGIMCLIKRCYLQCKVLHRYGLLDSTMTKTVNIPNEFSIG